MPRTAPGPSTRRCFIPRSSIGRSQFGFLLRSSRPLLGKYLSEPFIAFLRVFGYMASFHQFRLFVSSCSASLLSLSFLVPIVGRTRWSRSLRGKGCWPWASWGCWRLATFTISRLLLRNVARRRWRLPSGVSLIGFGRPPVIESSDGFCVNCGHPFARFLILFVTTATASPNEWLPS